MQTSCLFSNDIIQFDVHYSSKYIFVFLTENINMAICRNADLFCCQTNKQTLAYAELIKYSLFVTFHA